MVKEGSKFIIEMLTAVLTAVEFLPVKVTFKSKEYSITKAAHTASFLPNLPRTDEEPRQVSS